MKEAFKFLFLFCVLFGAQVTLAAPIVSGSFSTTWKTDNPGVTADNQIRFVLGSGNDGESCPGTIYWEEVGDAANNGSSTLDGLCNNETITFPSPGTYRVDVLGTHPSFRFSYGGASDAEKLLTVEQWGSNTWESFNASFKDAINFTEHATDVPDLSALTDMTSMFEGATSFNGEINDWDVSNVTDFGSMFRDATSFNQPLDGWVLGQRCLGSKENERFFVFEWLVPTVNACVNSVIVMTSMFQDATSFNQDLSAWRIEDNIVLLNMFRGAALSPVNYAAILNGWAALSPAASDVDLGIVSAQYCDTASSSRATLIDDYDWSITDLGSSVCVDESVSTRSNGGSVTVIGLRQKRLDDLKNSMSSSTAPMSEKLITFVTSLKKFLSYLTSHETEIKNWTPEESKTVIIVLRDAIRELLKWLPGV